MSDTPITDSYQNCYDGRFLPAMEKLERDNAALKVQIRELIATMEEEGEMDAVRIAELKKENAALRDLLLRTADALESEIEADERKGTWHNHAALAAARKEAQP